MEQTVTWNRNIIYVNFYVNLDVISCGNSSTKHNYKGSYKHDYCKGLASDDPWIKTRGEHLINSLRNRAVTESEKSNRIISYIICVCTFSMVFWACKDFQQC